MECSKDLEQNRFVNLEGGWRFVNGAWIPEITVCSLYSPKPSDIETSVVLNVNNDSSNISHQASVTNDLNFIVSEEKFGSYSVSNMVSVIVEDENTIRLKLKNYKLSSAKTASFTFKIWDEKVSPINLRFFLSKNKEYQYNINLYKDHLNYHELFTQDTIDYISDWLSSFFESYESAILENTDKFLVPGFEPPHLDQIPNEFSQFNHAIYYIRKIHRLSLQNVNEFIDNNLSEFKSLCLNKQLIENYYNLGIPKLVDLDLEYSQNQSLKKRIKKRMTLPGGDYIPIDFGANDGGNFLGVDLAVWSCIIENGIYKTSKDPPEYFGEVHPWDWRRFVNRRQKDFDCRAFSEAMLIFLRNQLKNVCPNASVRIVDAPNHSLLHVDLGGTGDCCNGSFFLEATGDGSGRIYEDYPDAEIMDDDFSWDDYSSENKTKWEKDNDQVNRIANIICGCIDDYAQDLASNGGELSTKDVEYNLKSNCDNNTMEDYLRNYYSYGKNNQNTPTTETPEIPQIPQVVGCVKYNCIENQGCIESVVSVPKLTAYECRNCSSNDTNGPCEVEGYFEIIEGPPIPEDDCYNLLVRQDAVYSGGPCSPPFDYVNTVALSEANLQGQYVLFYQDSAYSIKSAAERFDDNGNCTCAWDVYSTRIKYRAFTYNFNDRTWTDESFRFLTQTTKDSWNVDENCGQQGLGPDYKNPRQNDITCK